MADNASLIGSSLKRAVYTYDVPPGLQKTEQGDVITSLGFIELNSEDELDATKRARGDVIRLAFEMPKQSLRVVNGTPVSLADGSTDRWWNKMGPKLRNLAIAAHGDIHNVRNDDASSFLGSRKITAG